MDKVESVKEWRWEGGYEFDDVHELSDMLEAMKPGDVLYFTAHIPKYEFGVKIRLLRDGYYKLSTGTIIMRFNSWEVEDGYRIIPFSNGLRLSATIPVFRWMFSIRIHEDNDRLTSWIYDEMGD